MKIKDNKTAIIQIVILTFSFIESLNKYEQINNGWNILKNKVNILIGLFEKISHPYLLKNPLVSFKNKKNKFDKKMIKNEIIFKINIDLWKISSVIKEIKNLSDFKSFLFKKEIIIPKNKYSKIYWLKNVITMKI